MACLRWNPVTATNSSRMRPRSARLPLLYRSMTAATSSSRVAMLTRLIAVSPTPSGSGAFQMTQQINIREHFWRGNADRDSRTPENGGIAPHRDEGRRALDGLQGLGVVRLAEREQAGAKPGEAVHLPL